MNQEHERRLDRACRRKLCLCCQRADELQAEAEKMAILIQETMGIATALLKDPQTSLGPTAKAALALWMKQNQLDNPAHGAVD